MYIFFERVEMSAMQHCDKNVQITLKFPYMCDSADSYVIKRGSRSIYLLKLILLFQVVV